MTRTFNHFDMVFETQADFSAAIDCYRLAKLPTPCGRKYRGRAFDDHGREMPVLAERLLGNQLALRIIEVR